MKILRKISASLLMIFGTLTVLVSLRDLVGPRDDIGLHAAMLPTGIGFAWGGWLLWRGDTARRVLAILLMSFGVLGVLAGLQPALTGTEAVSHLLQGELRFGLPALACGWFLWRGMPTTKTVAVLILCWAVSYTIQALGVGEPFTVVILLARAALPGFACGWLLWRGCELRQIAAVLLISWPTSYLLYASIGYDWDSFSGELTVGVPTILVGWLLWRQPLSRAASSPVTPGVPTE